MLQSKQEALAKYILAAEESLGLSQINAAHLCEVNLWVGVVKVVLKGTVPPFINVGSSGAF